MANTTNFGFKKFPPGSIADSGNQYSLRDRDSMDALFFSLFNHDHSEANADVLTGVSHLVFPELELGTAGALAGGKTFYYKISYLDANGNETEASTAASVATPSPLAPPAAPGLLVATTGGTLVPGSYRYALSFYQGTAQTSAPETAVTAVPTGTNTNKITLSLPTAPDEAQGFKVYRRGPFDSDYYLLATVSALETEYVDDGSGTLDLAKRRPTRNGTSATNSVTVSIPASELPLDPRVKAWRIYRTENSANFSYNSLVATVVDTTTEGGVDLVTSYEDLGNSPGPGTPLLQSAIPPAIPTIASSLDSGRSYRSTFLIGTLAVGDYDQFVPLHDIEISKLEAFFKTAPSGVDSNDFVTIRVTSDDAANEVQRIWVETEPRNEVQRVVKSIDANTWTLTFDGQTTTAIPALPTAAQIKAALEALSNITEVFVISAGVRTWDVQFSDPGGQDVPEMTGTVSGGTITVTTTIEGNDGGEFTLSDGVDVTDVIAVDASAATLATRLETDLASIVDVTVTGTGTALDPWIVTWVDPDEVAVALLQLNGVELNGTGHVERVVRGHAAISVDLNAQTAVQYHSLTVASEGEAQEAEDAPAVTTGVDVSDEAASNGAAVELSSSDIVTWDLGVLPAGTYLAKYYVAPISSSSVTVSVLTDVATPVTLESRNIVDVRGSYTPAYELEFVADGIVDLQLKVELVSGLAARVDKLEWELITPTLVAGSTCKVEVVLTGTPGGNGADVNFSICY